MRYPPTKIKQQDFRSGHAYAVPGSTIALIGIEPGSEPEPERSTARLRGRLLLCAPHPLSFTMPREKPNSYWRTLGRLD